MKQDIESFKADAMRTAGGLIDLPLLQNLPHNLVLESLLLAFSAMAEHHACCLPNAARASARVAARLAALADGAPAGSHVH